MKSKIYTDSAWVYFFIPVAMQYLVTNGVSETSGVVKEVMDTAFYE